MIEQFASRVDSEQTDTEKQIECDALTKKCKELVVQIHCADPTAKRELEHALFEMPESILFRMAWEGLVDDQTDHLAGSILRKPSDREVRYRLSVLSEEQQSHAEIVAREWLGRRPS